MRNQKKQIDQPTAVSDHFTLPVHSMDNIELVPLEFSQGKRNISDLQGQDSWTFRLPRSRFSHSD